jgi:chemotaxis protein CheD
MAAAARATAFLHAGRIFVARRPHAVTTILGSCVTACLWDPQAEIGGLNHFLLPDVSAQGDGPRFGTAAMRMLIEQVCAAGASRRRLRAKVFGGAAITGAQRDPLGPKNAALALARLEEQNIPVVAQDCGGSRGRKLIFHTDDGEALVKLL